MDRRAFFSFQSFFNRKNLLILLAIVLLARAADMFLLPVFDPSEARYAAICSNMALRNNFLEPQFVYEGKLQNFEGKPPLYFQMGGIFCKLFGVNEFSVRLPALLAALGILAVLFFTVRKLRSERSAVIAALLCGTEPVFLIFCGFCMTDLLLCFTITAAVCSYTLFSAAEKIPEKKLWSCGFFVSLALGMIVKGPVALVMAGMPVFFFVLINNRWRELKSHAWIAGPVLFFLICLPWYVLMQLKNPDFLEYFFVNENFKRFLFKEYGDRYGAGRETFRGMSLVWFAACNFFCLIAASFPRFAGKKIFPRTRQEYRDLLADPLTGLAALTVITNVLFWGLTSRVLITYLLPTIPAAAVLVAELLEKRIPAEENRGNRLPAVWFSGAALFCAAGLLCLGHFSLRLEAGAGRFFRKVADAPENRGLRVYFLRRTPLSAEFYLRERVVNHPDESREKSLERSGRCLLFIPDGQLRKLTTPPKRKRIARGSRWSVYAPEEKR